MVIDCSVSECFSPLRSMESSGGNLQQPGAQNEPFFDLLQQGAAPTPSPSPVYPNYNTAKKMENSGDFKFGDFNSGGDDVLPNFDFQPIRTSAAPSANASSSSSSGAWIDENRGRQGSPPVSYTSYEPMVPRSREPPPTYETPVSRPQEHEKESFDSATAAAVERTMKKYADNLLRVLEGMDVRLSQLESSTEHLESLFQDVKNMVEENHGEADGKLRSLESHILEVHRGVQVLRDRQEIFEAQSQLAKLQLTAKGESVPPQTAPSAPPPTLEPPAQLSRASSGKALLEAPPQQVVDIPPSSYYQPQLQLQQMSPLPPPVPPRPQPQPQQPPQQQIQQQLQQQMQQQIQQQLQQQMQQQKQQQLQQPGVPQSEVPQQPLHQQPPPLPPSQQFSQPSQPPAPYPQQQQQQQLSSPYPQQQQQQPPPPPPPPIPQPPPIPNYGHPGESPPYGQHPQVPHPGPHHVGLPPSSYPSDLPSYHPSYGPSRPSIPPQQPLQLPPGPQQQQPQNVGTYESSMGRSGSGQLSLPTPYLTQGHPGSGSLHYEPQGLNPGSGYPGSSYRVAQPVPSAPSGGSGGYPRLPLAQPVPHALPTGGGGSGGPSSGAPPPSANRVPIEEVIDKVTNMGFPKDQVRAVVRRLTENGQSVDLNIVLDKLMNGDSAQAPPKGWFGR